MSLLAQLDQRIAANDGLTVSCWPVLDSPLDKPEIVTAVALTVEQTGTVVIRIESMVNLQATRAMVSIPIIGTVERDLGDSPVRIMAYIGDVSALAQAGANIIAIDGADRPHPVPVGTLLTHTHHHGSLTMTDCLTSEDGLAYQELGAEVTGTMLFGYTTPGTSEEPDPALMKTLSNAGCRAIAEGRYDTPAQTTDVMRHSAWAVTVGSTTAHPEHICRWYNTAMKKAVLWPHW